MFEYDWNTAKIVILHESTLSATQVFLICLCNRFPSPVSSWRKVKHRSILRKLGGKSAANNMESKMRRKQRRSENGIGIGSGKPSILHTCRYVTWHRLSSCNTKTPSLNSARCGEGRIWEFEYTSLPPCIRATRRCPIWHTVKFQIEQIQASLSLWQNKERLSQSCAWSCLFYFGSAKCSFQYDSDIPFTFHIYRRKADFEGMKHVLEKWKKGGKETKYAKSISEFHTCLSIQTANIEDH